MDGPNYPQFLLGHIIIFSAPSQGEAKGLIDICFEPNSFLYKTIYNYFNIIEIDIS